ncbi:unnamed protein product [Symbiodinium sp. KB8]|nr:unnamed protein product [Symbiodinium sp. KB8]
MFPAKRAPWETKGATKGVYLEDPGQLSIVTGKSLEGLCQTGIDFVHKESSGWSFANVSTVQRLSELETCSTFFLITKGYVKDKIYNFGVDRERVTEAVVTVVDPVSALCEPRAVTITNLACDPCDFVQPSHVEDCLEVKVTSMCAVLVELRKSDASAEDWAKYGCPTAVDEYIQSLLLAFGADKTAIQHRTNSKENYIVKRLMIPSGLRNRLYSKSGLELLRVEGAKYVRVCDSDLGEMRASLYPDSDRFSERNISLKIVNQYKCLGFPTGTTFPAVAELLFSLGWNVIPLRVLHLNELAIFFVGSDVDPPQYRFTTSAGPLVIHKLAVEERIQSRLKNKTVVGASNRNEKAGSSDMSAPSATSTASSPHTSARTAAFDPWANWKPSTTQASTPSNPLAARVERLEKQMSSVTNDVKDLRTDQIATNTKLETMQAENAEGFRSLMQAIQEMKMATSTSSTPVKSPPSKLSRQS